MGHLVYILLGCLPVYRTVSTVAMQVLGNAHPLDLASKCAAVRVKLRRNYPLKTSDWLYGEDLSGLS